MIQFFLLTSREIDQVLAFDDFYRVQPLRRDEVNRAIDDNAGYLMRVDNEIVGYGIFRPYALLEESFIHLLIIHPSHRGRGYAFAFMKYFESLSKTKRIHTSTNTSNIAMQNLLGKLGYQEGGRLISVDPDDPEIFFYKQLE